MITSYLVSGNIVMVKTKNPLSSNIREIEIIDYLNGTFIGKTGYQYSTGGITWHASRVVNQIKKITHIYQNEKWEPVM